MATNAIIAQMIFNVTECLTFLTIDITMIPMAPVKFSN